MKRLRLSLFVMIWVVFAMPLLASAHVKWFATWSFKDVPSMVGVIIQPLTVGLLLFTMAALAIAVLLDRQLQRFAWYARLNTWFENRKNLAPLVLRIGLGMTLLLNWQANTLLAPELVLQDSFLGWVQFVLALLLIFPQTTPLAGIGTLILYVLGVFQFGAFWMLDYFLFVGVAIYLIVATLPNERVRALRIPALYFSVGFSLMWVAIEKLVYPQWGLQILGANPVLTLGFPPEFFLIGAAFVELALGYLFIIGLLERPIAILVTLVFFTTTLVFGKVEIIGHTIIHAALIVFLLEGTQASPYPAPINIHRQLTWRAAFAAVNFAILVVVLLLPYEVMANAAYNNAITVFNPLLSVLMR